MNLLLWCHVSRAVFIVLVFIAWGAAVFMVAQYWALGAILAAVLFGVPALMVFYSSTKLDRGEGIIESLTVSIGVATAGVAGLLAGGVIALAGWQACRTWGWLLSYDGDAYCRVEWMPWLAIGVLVAEIPLIAVAWPELRQWVLRWRATDLGAHKRRGRSPGARKPPGRKA